MKRCLNVGSLGLAAMAGVILAAGTAGQAAEPGDRALPARPFGARIWLVDAPAANYTAVATVGEYWLGVGLQPASELLRAHLDLPKDQGLVIAHIAPDSPAAKSGLKVHDILLKAGEHKIAEQSDLVKALDESKGDQIKLEFIRSGKPHSLTVKAEKRPKTLTLRDVHRLRKPDLEELRKWIERMEKDGAGPLRLRTFGEGRVILDKHHAGGLPEGVSISITKSGKDPAKIKVERGDESWEITAEQIDKLPEDLRPAVRRMLSPRPVPRLDVKGLQVPGLPGVRIEVGREKSAAPIKRRIHSPPGPPEPGRFEDRLKQLDQRVEQLVEELQKLREDRAKQREQRRKQEQP